MHNLCSAVQCWSACVWALHTINWTKCGPWIIAGNISVVAKAATVSMPLVSQSTSQRSPVPHSWMCTLPLCTQLTQCTVSHLHNGVLGNKIVCLWGFTLYSGIPNMATLQLKQCVLISVFTSMKNFNRLSFRNIAGGGRGCHLWVDHITWADTLLVEGNTKYIIKCFI